MTRIPSHPGSETDTRTLPAEPMPFPNRLGMYTVIAAALIPSRDGEVPNVARMILHDASRPVLRAYSVVTGRSSDGSWGGAWSAGNGTHDCSYVNAMEIFIEKLNGDI
jgi:hypothetical protein